jgi:YggT family protein
MYVGSSIIIGLVDFFIGLVELLLGLRVILRLFAANPDSPFVHWIYATSGTVMAPFRGIFPTEVIHRGGYVLDISAIFAMIVYAVIGYLIVSLLGWLPAQKTRGYRLTRR